MRRWLLLIAILSLAPAAFCQNVRYDNVVIGPRGPIPNATIAVCTQPATISTTPCSPLASLFNTAAGGGAAPNPLLSDSSGNYHFYAAPGIYTIQIYGAQLQTPFVMTDVGFGGNILSTGNNAFTGNNTHSGTETFTGPVLDKTLNAIQFADQYVTTATVSAPANAPALYTATSGGTVAANNYKCEVTFIGATSGETTASPASASITTTGAVSILYCNQNEVPPPAGALTYNVYWQTAGAGSYFQGHTSVALGVNDAQTTTPPTSGSTPPGANTALAILPSVQTAIGGAGTEIIPSTVSATLGAAGSPTAGQTIFDWRTGQIFSRPASGKGHYISAPGAFNNTQEDFFRISINGLNSQSEMNLLFNPTFNAIEGFSAGIIVPNSSSTGQANAIAGYAVDQRTNPLTPSVGIFGVGRVAALNARVWGGNFVGTDQGGTNTSSSMYGEESDCFVANVASLCVAHLAEAFWIAGIQPTNSVAFRVGQPGGSVANARWSTGFRCDTNATFSTDGNNGCLFMFPVATGATQNSQGIEFISTRSDSVSIGGALNQLPPGDLQFQTTAAGTAGFVCNGCNSIRPGVVNQTDLGSTALPFLNLWLGTAATNNFKFQPGATAGARIVTMTDPVSPTTVGLPFTIASGTSTLTANAALAAVTSQAAITTAGTGILTTDTIEWSYATAPTAGDSLCHVSPYVTAGNVNFVRTNPTAAAQNVSALVINWRVIR